HGPNHIFDASMQVDLYDAEFPGAWKNGIYMLPVDRNIRKKSDYLRQCTELIHCHMAEGGLVKDNEQLAGKMKEINEASVVLRDVIFEMACNLMKRGKKLGLVGGDHSTPLGFIKAMGTEHADFGVLQIDAHCDLREAYEGFTYSHASVMYNVLQEVPQVSKLVQLGIRDYCDEEIDRINSSNGRIATFFDYDIKCRQYAGESWKSICDSIVAALPQKVYISFDIDGLDPKLCPNTGTPVPGGFETEQIYYLFKILKESGREIIGFDLNEVSCGIHTGDGIDAIVGARVLYKLCNYLL
ncbi:MAG: agmatinase, partial [Chitinophagia bacterium]|nr:agmatinase [Chitinophagia bacterium]